MGASPGAAILVGDDSFMRLRSLLRRCAALALMLCLGLFSTVEVAIADVHDGDAEIAQIEGSGAAAAGTRAPDGPAPGEPHSVHVDHCAHGHAAPVVARQQHHEPPSAHMVVVGLSQRAPVLPAAAPPVPPPVA